MNAPIPFAPILFLLGLLAGILLGETRGGAAAAGGLIAGLVACGAGLLVRAPAARVALGVLGLALVGGASMQRALEGLEHSPLAAAVAARADVVVRGALVDDPDAGRYSARVLLRVERASLTGVEPRGNVGGRRVVASATGDAAARLRLLAAGESLTARGWLDPLTGYDARARWKHAVATFHVTDVVAVEPARSPLARVANSARALVLGGAEPLGSVDRAVLAGFLLGDTRALPEAVEEQLRAAGLTHLMAVSGGNVAFVLALVAPALRRFGLRGRVIGAAAVLVLFGTMTRWEPSVARAIAMTAIGLLAGYLGRPTAGLRALVLAAIVLLLIDPFLVHSVGFGLSCAASLGIALWSRPIAARLRGPRWLREVLAVTAAAQVGVAPVLLPVFGSMPLVALPANLVAVPLAAPLTMWGIASGVVSGLALPLTPAVGGVLAIPTRAMLHALLTVAALASRVPVEIDGRAIWALAACGALVGAATRARNLRRDGRLLPTR